MLFFNLFVVAFCALTARADYGGDASSSYEPKMYDKTVEAAVKSNHMINTYPVQSTQMNAKTPIVDINSGPLPIVIRFNSHSSQINAIQKHFGQMGTVQKASHVDEPDLLIQQVKKPVIQEIREIIQPFRQRTQEVRPVQEKVETVIAQGKNYSEKKYPGADIGGGHGGGDYDKRARA